MKQIKIVLLAVGILGLLCIFALPYISVEGHSIKLWDMHGEKASATEGLLNGPKQVYIQIVGFLLALGAGAFGMAQKRLPRGAAIAAAVGGLLVMATSTGRGGISSFMGMSTAIGGKLLFLSALVAIIAGVVGAAKPENA